MTDMGTAAHYWDASALVKLVAPDADDAPGRATVRDYFFAHEHHYSTSACIAEALSVLKRKWLRGLLSQDQYVFAVREFYRLVVSGLSVDDVPVSVQLLDAAEGLMRQHDIDFIDSVQVVTVLHGRYSVFIGDSKSLFITADRTLAKAAREEGARVWECSSEPSYT
jgi:predicted nucleic acid-binding protein